MNDIGKIDEEVLADYLRFVVERHRIWEARQRGEPAPWSDDPVLRTRKFTNVFRVLDWGSQFLIKELLYGEDRGELTIRDVIFRSFLYRYTNRPDAWEFFRVYHGEYPRSGNVDVLEETWELFRAKGGGVFGQAYTMFSGAENKGMSRVGWVVDMARRYFTADSPDDIVVPLVRTSVLRERLDILQTVPRCAGFMSMQVATDIGYSGGLPSDENETVIAGPGAQRGAKALAPEADPVDTIYWARERLLEMEDCPRIILPDGRSRQPSLLDVQNTFCELSKYLRYKESPKNGRSYSPAHATIPSPVLPAHW